MVDEGDIRRPLRRILEVVVVDHPPGDVESRTMTSP